MAVDFTVYRAKKGVDIDTAIWTQDKSLKAEIVFDVRHGSDFRELVVEMFKDEENRLSDETDNIQCFLSDFMTPQAQELINDSIDKYHLFTREEYEQFVNLLKEAETSDEFYLFCSVI